MIFVEEEEEAPVKNQLDVNSVINKFLVKMRAIKNFKSLLGS